MLTQLLLAASLTVFLSGVIILACVYFGARNTKAEKDAND